MLSMRVDPQGTAGTRWHVPRLRVGDPERLSVQPTTVVPLAWTSLYS